MRKIFLLACYVGFVSVLSSCGNKATEEASEYEEYSYTETITVENRNTEWESYGKVNALWFNAFDWLVCIGDATKYNEISERFYELEDEGGYYNKPLHSSIFIDYRYLDGEKQYRMYHRHRGPRGKYINFSLNPHNTIEYVVDNNNRPQMKTKDVSSYSHFLEVDGILYFIKVE